MRSVVFLFLLIGTLTVNAAETDQLFTQQQWPISFSAKHGASCFTINTEAFAKARQLSNNQSMSLSIWLPKIGTVEILASRYFVVDQQTSIVAMTNKGPQPVPPPQSVLLRGRIIDIPDSYVILAVYPDWCTGLITTGPMALNRTYRISPLAQEISPQTMVVYDGADVPAVNDWNCGTLDPTDVQPPTPKGGDGVQAVTYRQIKLSIECDEPFYIDHGRDLTRATQYAEAVVAASSAIYERDVTATLTIGSLVVWTTTDPYTSNLPDEMLVQFRDRWRSLHGSVNRSVAHLFSGVNNIGGIAYLDQLCNKQWGYAVVGTNNNVTYPAAGYVWDTDVFSHELGHNVGSPHTHSCTWNPPIDSCYNAEGGCFTGTKAKKGTIMSYCHLTASGTDLSFHSRVVTLMQAELAASACTPLVSIFSITAPDAASVCLGDATSITVSPSGGIGPITYRWRGPMMDTTTQSQTLVLRPTSSFKLLITASDSVGNSINDSTQISVHAKPLAQITPTEDRVCSGTVVEVTSLVSGGRLPYSYRWLKNGVVVDTVSDMVWPRIDSTTTIRLIVVDLNGCGDTADVQIFVPDHRLVLQPASLVLPPLTVCEQGFTSTITLRNDGLETVVIDSIITRTSISVAANLPIVVPAATAIPVQLVTSIKTVGAIRDTITFVTQTCNTRFTLPITGNKEEVKIISPLPLDLGAKIVCDTPTARYASVRIDNPSPFPVHVTGIVGRLFGSAISLVNGSVTIPSTSEQAITITTDIKRLPGVHTDSLTISYISEGCEGAITIPASLRVVGLSIDHPQTINFDTVLTSESGLSRTFTISVSLIGSTKTTVQNVRVDGPFTTTMSDGLILPHSRQTPVSVSIAPSQLTIDGEVNGTLTFSLDSCGADRSIDLKAFVRTVGVSEGSTSVPPYETKGESHVYDLRGMWLGTFPAEPLQRFIDGLASGVYVIINTHSGQLRTHRLICR